MKKYKIIYITLLIISTSFIGCSNPKYSNLVVPEPDKYVDTEVTSSSESNNKDGIYSCDIKDKYEEVIDEIIEVNEEDKTVSICMVGDILLHDNVEYCSMREDGTYDYSQIFVNLKEDIASCDLAIVNQEVIIGGEGLGVTGYPSFNAPYEVGDALVDTGFDVVCHATNHALDKGAKGITNCLEYWKNNHPHITILGIHDSTESQDKINVVEVKGIRIALLNYTYGTNGISMPPNMPFAVDMLNEEKVKKDIERAKKLSDFIVVCPHWGTEYRLTSDSYQEKWINIFFDEGVNLVIGTHPHVIEPIEMIVDEETGKEMLVYYSLGNFVNWTSGVGEGISNRVVGGMANITISKDDNNEVNIEEYDVTALVTDLHKSLDGITVYELSNYTEDQALLNEIKKQDNNFRLDYCTNLCDKVWDNKWK